LDSGGKEGRREEGGRTVPWSFWLPVVGTVIARLVQFDLDKGLSLSQIIP